MITAVSKVVIPITDQEAAKEFWTTVVGFEATLDAEYGGGERWIEVTPPDGSRGQALRARLRTENASRIRGDSAVHGLSGPADEPKIGRSYSN